MRRHRERVDLRLLPGQCMARSEHRGCRERAGGGAWGALSLGRRGGEGVGGGGEETRTVGEDDGGEAVLEGEEAVDEEVGEEGGEVVGRCCCEWR